MTRIVHVADGHFTASSRFDECVRMHAFIADYVRRERPNVVVNAGDVYHAGSSPIEREAAADHHQQITEICPDIIVRGNHDRPLDLAILRRIKTPERNPILVFEEPAVVSVGGATFGCIPWPRKAGIHAAARGIGLPAAEQDASEALRSILRWMGTRFEETNLPRMLVMHAMVDGAVTSHGQPLVGADMSIGLSDFALANADAYALGHIHCHQHWMIGNAPVIYPGSPYRTAFGEKETKGFVVWNIERGQATWEFIELPATPMVLLEADWKPAHDTFPAGFSTDIDGHTANGAEIRFRYRVEAEHQATARAAAEDVKRRALSSGAVSVQIEPVVQVTTRERATEIMQASTLTAQLQCLWRSQNNYPNPPVESRLLEKLSELELEVGT
jgi:exonuclease SbcD